jgi:hypothetical protein
VSSALSKAATKHICTQIALYRGLQAALQKQIAGELEWLQQSAKGQQKKGKARLRRYDDLVEEVQSAKQNSLSI